MIVFNRVASIQPGKTSAAVAFAKEIAAYMKSSYDVELDVLMPIGGNPSRVGWSARYKDLAAMDSVQTRMLADAKYWEIVNKSSDLWLAGSLHDSIWRTL